MTYDPLIPQATEIISVSQPKILENFTQLNTIFGIDHVEFNNAIAANRGKHTKITYVQQGADPTTLVSEIALYTKNVGGTPRLFIREQSNGTSYQLSGPTPSRATNGYSWLPGGAAGGILIQWGQFNIPNNSNQQSVSFPIAFSAVPYSVIPTIRTATGSERIFCNVNSNTPPSATGFVANVRDQSSGGGSGSIIFWVAIGPS